MDEQKQTRPDEFTVAEDVRASVCQRDGGRHAGQKADVGRRLHGGAELERLRRRVSQFRNLPDVNRELQPRRAAQRPEPVARP